MSKTLQQAIDETHVEQFGYDSADTLMRTDGYFNADGSENIVNQLLDGRGGDDSLYGQAGNDVLLGGEGNDMLVGSGGDDWLDGGAGDDTVDAGSGDDNVLASAGTDSYVGGSGFDTLDFSAAAAALAIDLSKGTATGGNFVSSFDSFEKVVGSSFSDTIRGSDRVDVIDGGAGNDMIRSKAGADILTGGAGRDTFQFLKKDVMLDGAHQGVDVITDFKSNDLIDLNDFFKGQVSARQAGSVIQLTDTDEGTMVAAKLGGAFVNVALLQGVHIPAETTVSALASDGFFVL